MCALRFDLAQLAPVNQQRQLNNQPRAHRQALVMQIEFGKLELKIVGINVVHLLVNVPFVEMKVIVAQDINFKIIKAALIL